MSVFLRGLAVGLGGFLGAACRYWVGAWVERGSAGLFPWGTLVVNVTGAFLLGWLLHAGLIRGALPSRWQLILATGFLGAYTTFSTFTWETLRLAVAGSWPRAVANLGLSVFLGLLGVWLGAVLDRALAGG